MLGELMKYMNWSMTRAAFDELRRTTEASWTVAEWRPFSNCTIIRLDWSSATKTESLYVLIHLAEIEPSAMIVDFHTWPIRAGIPVLILLNRSLLFDPVCPTRRRVRVVQIEPTYTWSVTEDAQDADNFSSRCPSACYYLHCYFEHSYNFEPQQYVHNNSSWRSSQVIFFCNYAM